jgi:hypothetical protein
MSATHRLVRTLAVSAAVALAAPAAALAGSSLPGPPAGGPSAPTHHVPVPTGSQVASGVTAQHPDEGVVVPPSPGTHPIPLAPRKPLPPKSGGNKGVGRAGADRGSPNYMLYRGGAVQTSPRIYIVYWGNWSLANDPYNVQNRLYYFLRGVGGSYWNSTATQYAQGCQVGTYTCGSGATFITNPANQLKNYWKDTSFVPLTPTDADLKREAVRAAQHFGDYGANAQYVIAVARGHDPDGFPTKRTSGAYCAYHWWASTGSRTISFTNLPYMPDAGAHGCWNGSLTGNMLDGVTIVESHEYSESITDPFGNGWNDVDAMKGESGDKCAGLPSAGYDANMQFSTGAFPVQSTWSNYHRYWYGDGCALWFY